MFNLVATMPNLYQPFNMFDSFEKKIEQRLKSIFKDEFLDSKSDAVPKVDIYYTDDNICVEANVAGFSKDEISVTEEKINNGVKLSIEVQKKVKDNRNLVFNELSYSRSRRILVLQEISGEPKIDLKDGILFIQYDRVKPKKNETVRKLSISSS